MARRITGEELLTSAEVAKIFRVDPKTVTRWANEGKLSSIRTLGGHRRFRAAEVEAALNGEVEGAALRDPAVRAAVTEARTGDRSQLRHR